jgi:hypothetical protein
MLGYFFALQTLQWGRIIIHVMGTTSLVTKDT